MQGAGRLELATSHVLAFRSIRKSVQQASGLQTRQSIPMDLGRQFGIITCQSIHTTCISNCISTHICESNTYSVSVVVPSENISVMCTCNVHIYTLHICSMLRPCRSSNESPTGLPSPKSVRVVSSFRVPIPAECSPFLLRDFLTGLFVSHPPG